MMKATAGIICVHYSRRNLTSMHRQCVSRNVLVLVSFGFLLVSLPPACNTKVSVLTGRQRPCHSAQRPPSFPISLPETLCGILGVFAYASGRVTCKVACVLCGPFILLRHVRFFFLFSFWCRTGSFAIGVWVCCVLSI